MKTLTALALLAALTAGTAQAQTFRELAKQGERQKAADLVADAKEWRALGGLKEAMKCYADALEIDPKCAAAHAGIAWVHNDGGEYAKAITAAGKATKLDPKCGEAWREQGYAEWKQGKEKAAKQSLATAVECDPTDMTGYAYLIAVLDDLGDKKAAGEYRKLRDAEADRQANPEQKPKVIY